MNIVKHQLFEDSGGKILTVMVGGQQFGIQLLDTKEIIGVMEVEPIPHTPSFMLGMINLRDKIIPVIDLRIKLGFTPQPPTKENCIVIIEIHGHLTGALVDSLVGVTTLKPEEFDDHPNLGNSIRADFIAGISFKEQGMVFILDMDKILLNEELELIQNASELVA